MPASSPVIVRHSRRRRLRVALLYTQAILLEFRGTLIALAILLIIGAALHLITPQPQLSNGRLPFGTAVYAGWMALLAQPQFAPPQPGYLIFIYSIYPLCGFILIGEGVIRLAQLMMSRRRGEKEWMIVMASTYRDHVILCGLGRLGIRVLEQLVTAGVAVVALEKDPLSAFIDQARTMGVPVLLRDMKEDQALIDAGIVYADAIISCSNDDMANLEVALDARRMNPKIRVVLRMFEQAVASKIAGALTIDAAFSASSLAAPVVAAMSLKTKVLSTMMIAGVPHVAAEVTVAADSHLAQKRIGELEVGYGARVLARTPAGAATQDSPTPGTALTAGDTLVVYAPASQMPTIAAAAGARDLVARI
ncbi:MAG TPA: NAD-binding protein [Tepidisphaeraceae bacterium]|nr:NAD-binding protein [Tepidisphaeraceae bacterium]